MIELRHGLKRLAAAGALAAVLGLGGCGGVDGVELNGKIFDWLGISSSALDASKTEPKLVARAPLVLPPESTRLPEPGSGQQVEIAGVEDPEQKKAAAAKERQRLHEAYCRGEIQWKEGVFDKNKANRSPYGPCSSLLSGIVKQ